MIGTIRGRRSELGSSARVLRLTPIARRKLRCSRVRLVVELWIGSRTLRFSRAAQVV